jgi:uncharacterized protein with beta-barrel porin domain
MPGKSKRKQMRYASSKQNKTAQPQATVTAATTHAAGTAVAAKPQTAPVKTTSGAKASVAQYTPELLKHVGSELKITAALSAGIIIVIIILAFVLH